MAAPAPAVQQIQYGGFCTCLKQIHCGSSGARVSVQQIQYCERCIFVQQIQYGGSCTCVQQIKNVLFLHNASTFYNKFKIIAHVPVYS